MSDGPRKRSRFDQGETADPRRSRFDRRSRSPNARDSGDGGRRERSPVGRSTESPALDAEKQSSAASAAAAAAARINAQLQAKKAAGALTPTPVKPVSLLILLRRLLL